MKCFKHAVLFAPGILFALAQCSTSMTYAQDAVVYSSSALQNPAATAQEPAIVQAAPAAGGCDTQCCDTGRLIGFGDDATIQLGGWASFGYHDESNGLFNSHPDRFNAHQVWLFAEKAAKTDSCCLDFGFRFDIMYGVDAADTQAFGNNAGNWDTGANFNRGQYGWALPQAYLEIGFNDMSVKIGHFYTLVGYEVVGAPDNFFYSHAITMYNTEPFTHTGVLIEKSLSDDVTFYSGYTMGWDTGFDRTNNGASYIGGLGVALNENTDLTYILTAGNFGARSNGNNGYSHSVVLDMSICENLNWVVQSDMLRIDGTGEDNIGLNQYLIYTCSDRLSLGTRVEWWKGDNVTGYAPFGGVLGTGSHSYYEATFGANYTICNNLTIRPEYRLDWSPALGYDEGSFGIDFVATF